MIPVYFKENSQSSKPSDVTPLNLISDNIRDYVIIYVLIFQYFST